MQFRFFAIIGIMILCAVSATSVIGQKSKDKTAEPIKLAEVWKRGIEGRLGIKLGTVVELSGQVVPNTSKAKGDHDEPFFLHVENVDDKKLEKPVDFSSSAMPLKEKLPKLKVGDLFHCAGYETGEYEGIVVNKYSPTAAGIGYHFHTHFVVLSEK